MSEASDTAPRRPMGESQRDMLARVREARRAFVLLLHEIGGTSPNGGRLASANLTLALRHIEDAESRAERHIKSSGHE